MAFGRTFHMKERYALMFRVEFQNIFNRLFYSAPSDGSAFAVAPTFTTSPTIRGNSLNGVTGLLSSGFGYVNWLGGAGALPRSGQIVARFTF
jgi:hypothetical protein